MAGEVQRRRAMVVVGVFLTVTVALGSVVGLRALGRGAATTTRTAAVSTSSDPTTTAATTTTTDPRPAVGTLPQTHVLPPPVTPSLTGRMRDLLAAVATGDVGPGIPAFFPVGAYVQTKIYWDAAHDWRTRLIPEYAADIRHLHDQLDPAGRPMRLLGYAVDDAAAIWVLPGEEFNKGPYWRVYYTTVAYGIGSAKGSFTINTLISWRGEWYVAHVSNFNS